MRKRIVLIAVLASALFLTACSAGSGTASQQTGDNSYSVSFDYWGGSVSHSLTLEKGDTLQVNITRDAGTIRLTITGADGNQIYAGNWKESSSFTVGVPTSQKYTVTVAGDNAKGRIDVSLAE